MNPWIVTPVLTGMIDMKAYKTHPSHNEQNSKDEL